MTIAGKALTLFSLGCALLVAIALLKYIGRHETIIEPMKLEQVVTQDRLIQLTDYCQLFKQRANRFPATAEEVRIMFPSISSDSILDGWGRSFRFYTNSAGGLTLASYGADGRPGGLGTNGDFIMQVK